MITMSNEGEVALWDA